RARPRWARGRRIAGSDAHVHARGDLRAGLRRLRVARRERGVRRRLRRRLRELRSRGGDDFVVADDFVAGRPSPFGTMGSVAEASEPVRIDRWLWAARLAKTRALAVEALKGGRVAVNGQSAKPSKDVRPGDRVEV